MAPRGLSFEGKRTKLIEVFHETKDFFQLRELEKLGSKKGIVSQTVKEVLQSLVDDGLVTMDKVGISNFYWSFPSARQSTLTGQMTSCEEEQVQGKALRAELLAEIEKEKNLRADTPERIGSLAQLAELQQTLAVLRKEKAQYGTCDPELYETKLRAVKLAEEAADRWKDNVQIVFSHFTNLHGVPPADARRHFGLVSDDI